MNLSVKRLKKSARSVKDVNVKDGFEEWGGYMEAKKCKLTEQFKDVTCNVVKPVSLIFCGVAVYVNGYTKPPAHVLKVLMAAHGGLFHLYQMSTTTHIIASNLPNVKLKQLGNIPIVRADWITDSIDAKKLLDYSNYLLYTNANSKQNTLTFSPAKIISTDITVNAKTVIKSKVGSINVCKTASDPDFLSEFYNNSRLHLISTLGTEFKQLVNRLREKSDGYFPGMQKLQKFQQSLLENSAVSVVMHIDMDCFFVSVGLRKNPELRGLPVAVTHASNPRFSTNRSAVNTEVEMDLLNNGSYSNLDIKKVNVRDSMSEIACCSYEARKCGIKNGMFLGTAIKLCPNLRTIPYDFEDYREVSHILYRTIASYTLDIEAVSCDEMYVNVGPILKAAKIDVHKWATHIREEIINATNCPCSTGFGANRLQARLATKKAKPSGQFYLRPEQLASHMAVTNLADLPGVGSATIAKLKLMGLMTCGDVQKSSVARLQTEFGQKNGLQIFEQAQGIDGKPLNFRYERRSVSADVNYGIRFRDKIEASNFLKNLSNEVWNRLREIDMTAKCVTLKLLVKAPHAPEEPAKFLGHGICNSVNRSSTRKLLNDPCLIFNEAQTLFEQLNVSPKELRGVGIHLTKLEKIIPNNYSLNRFFTSDIREVGSKRVKLIDNPKIEKVEGAIDFLVPTKSVDECKVVEEETNEVNFVPRNTTVFDDLGWKDLQVVIIDWLNSGHEPNKFDVAMLAQYFKQFALSRKIEKLGQMLNFLHRRIFILKLCLWHEAYETILNTIQDEMLETYGSTLRAERKFNNCLIHR